MQQIHLVVLMKLSPGFDATNTPSSINETVPWFWVKSNSENANFILNFLQSHSSILCTWNGFVDDESTIHSYKLMLGTKPGYDDIYTSNLLLSHQTRYVMEGKLQTCIITSCWSQHEEWIWADYL